MTVKTKKERVKELIGKSAMQCFARYGLEKTTLDDIAKAVGLNKASLYYYYKNKEDIFLEVAVNEGEQSIRDLQEKTLQQHGLEQQVAFYLQERFNYYKNVLNLNKISPEMVNRLLPRFFELYDGMVQEEIRFLATLISNGIQAEEIMHTDAEQLAGSLMNMCDALKHNTEQQALLKGSATTDYSMAIANLTLLVNLIFRGLKK